MGIYTKRGDTGTTQLGDKTIVSKSDERIELLGSIDELSSNIGLAKVIAGPQLKENLTQIQIQLSQMMAGISEPQNPEYNFTKELTLDLENKIDHLENSFQRKKCFVLYGGCEESARLDVARAITRRVERRFKSVSQNYTVDKKAMQYINRLSDYLYIAARYADYLNSVDK